MPIQNEFELLVTKNRLAEFQLALSQITQTGALGQGTLLHQITASALQSQIDDLKGQIESWNNTPQAYYNPDKE